MANSRIQILSRLASFACGVISILVSNAYGAVFGAIGDPGHLSYGRLDSHSVALAVVGGFAVIVSLLPTSWLRRLYNVGPDEPLPSLPIKVLGGFAAFSYFLTVGLYFAPASWHPDPWLVFSVCPACVLTFTVDPSLASVLVLLAPLDAGVYGALGAVLGYLLVILRNRS